MNTDELLAKAKELIAKGDIEAAKTFLTDNKDAFGEQFEKAKGILEAADLGKITDKVKGLFGK